MQPTNHRRGAGSGRATHITRSFTCGPRPPAPTLEGSRSILRRLFVSVSVFAAAALAAPGVQAQTVPDLPAPGDSLYEIRLVDGTRIVGRIAQVDQARAILTLPDGDRLHIDRTQVRQVRPARGRIVNGRFWRDDPGRTRLFFAATGRSLGPREAYINAHFVTRIGAAGAIGEFGIAPRVMIGAGMPFLIPEGGGFYFAPKVQVIRRSKLQVALGALAFIPYTVAYGVGTFGDADDALSAGLSVVYWDGRSWTTAIVGGEMRVGRLKLITENHFFAGGGIVSGGVRLIGDPLVAEVAIGSLLEGDCCLLLVNLSLSHGFGR